MARRTHGNDWRWDQTNHPFPSLPSIRVIDGAEPRPEPPGARRVSFGFSRELAPTASASVNDEADTTTNGW
jgi:hypothetical protein